MVQPVKGLTRGDALRQALEGYVDASRLPAQRLLYAALLGAALEALLQTRPTILEVPHFAWSIGTAVVAALYPYHARYLLAAIVALYLTSTSLAALALFTGCTLVFLLAGAEGHSFTIPVRFGLLVATPFAAFGGLFLLPLAAASALLAEAAWLDALLQALALVVIVPFTGTALPALGLSPAPLPLTGWGSAAVPLEAWPQQLDKLWDQALLPWVRQAFSAPVPYLKLLGLWTFAGLVGGRATLAARHELLRLPAALVAPAIAILGLAVFRGAEPDQAEWLWAVAAALLAWLLALLLVPLVPRHAGWAETTPVGLARAGGKRPSSPATATASGAGALRAAKWSDIAGYEDVKREVREALEPLTNAELRAKLKSAGIEPDRGILLYGPPGTGKTMLARAAASELGLGCVVVSGPEVLGKYVGESEAAVRQAFAEAAGKAPSILFFDEIEALVPPRSGGSDGMSGVGRTVVATFLGLMDGARELGAVMVIAATNAPDQIDSALLRPGRFDRVVYVPAPDPDTRREILRRSLQGKPGANQVDVEALIKPTERFTGADLAGLIRRAYEATRGEPISTGMLLNIVKMTKPTVTLAMLDQYRALAERFGRTSGTMAQMDAAPRPKLTWDDVGGLDRAKQALREAVMLPLEHPELVTKYGVKPSRGVLLYGPPGTGKTLLARVVADQAKATFLSASGSELAGPHGPEAIRQLFARAREAAPAILFVDEIDAIGHRGAAALGGTAVHQLLVEMDGVRAAESLVVMAATNRPHDLDEALLRPGRFDARVEVGLPDAVARQAILQLHLKGKPGAEKVDVARLVQLTEGYSPAEISSAVNAAARHAALAAAKAGQELEGFGLTTEGILIQLQAQSAGPR